MRKLPSLTAFFPCHNEAGAVESVANSALAVLPRVAEQYELIIVDDGSRDRTGEIADRIAAGDERVRAVHHETNRGYGRALRAGFRAARHEYVFFTDGDGQFDPGELVELVRRVDEADMVIGYRIERADPPHRLLFARWWGLLLRVLLGLNVRDVNCAFKLIPRAVLDSVELESEGALISAELLCKAAGQGYTHVEIGVRHHPQETPGTGGSPGVILKAFAELLRLWPRMRRGATRRSGL
jgi:glycosyltransferase involved in cell wall biosynthesis